MKPLACWILSLAALAHAPVRNPSTRAGEATGGANFAHDSAAPPLACALDSVARAAQEGALQRLAAAAEHVTEDAGGLVLEFTSDAVLADLVQALRVERRCCPFLGFEIHLAAASAGVVVRVRCPPEALEFVREVMGQ